MAKVIKNVNVPKHPDEIPVGECFIYNNMLFMRIKNDRRYQNLNLETGVVWTGIHDDVLVSQVNTEIKAG